MSNNNTQAAVDDHVQRMLDEANQLDNRVGKLSVFTKQEGGVFDSLPPLDQYLLVGQLAVMQSYQAILALRLKLATERGVFLAETDALN